MAGEVIEVEKNAETVAGRQGSGKNRWLPYLAIVALAQVALLLHVLPQDPAMNAKLQQLSEPLYRMQQQRQLAALMRDDPPLGAKVIPEESGPLRPVLAGSARSGRPVTLIFIGACSECVAHELLDWQHAALSSAGSDVAFVSRDTADNIARFHQKHACSLPIISDPTGQLGGRLNVAWAPRAYAVTADGRLRWIQKNPSMPPEAIGHAIWGTKG